MRRVHLSSIFRYIMASLESFWNRSHISDTASDDTDTTRSRHKRALHSSSRSLQGRLPKLGRRRISGNLDAEIQDNVQQPYTTEMISKYEENIDLPKTREEEFAECTFEWVKTERVGDISKFKTFLVENDVEYVVFQDNTRINSALLGDIVMMHKSEFDLMTVREDFTEVLPKEEVPVSVESLPVPPPAQVAVEVKQPEKDNPVHALLGKAKKKKQKLMLQLELQLPSEEMYTIISDNFENGDDEIVEFIMAELSPDLIKRAINSALRDKYTNKQKQ
jgi:hypothetical protein